MLVASAQQVDVSQYFQTAPPRESNSKYLNVTTINTLGLQTLNAVLVFISQLQPGRLEGRCGLESDKRVFKTKKRIVSAKGFEPLRAKPMRIHLRDREALQIESLESHAITTRPN